ncbi:MAG: hypothetical protein K9G03_01170 [Pontimonas sp.]|nr:hypothetical protein [Pontimonas sp.]
MRLGSRFSVGKTPSSIPAELAKRIEQVEGSLTEDERATLRWTLTWLENRPIVELDNGVVLRG